MHSDGRSKQRHAVADTGAERSRSGAPAPVALAQEAVGRAAAAFPAWSALGPTGRRMVLLAAADALEARSSAFIALMRDETGATEAWARFNLGLGAGILREAAAAVTRIGGEVIPSDRPGCLALALREPVGVLLGIAPWNAPIILGVRAVAMPLACGNTVVFKASERCPRTHALIADAFGAAGLPPGALELVTHAPADAEAVVAALIDHPAVRRINFTGSTRVGRIVARRAAEHLKPVLLELGGKAPLVVLDDADLDEAARAASFGAFANAGQICMSTERIIVVDAVADAFAARFRARVEALMGDDTAIGPVIDRGAVDAAEALIADARDQGAELLVGGGGTDGLRMRPQVLDRVTPAMRLFREESFAPVVGITRARDEADAIGLANDGEYGLSAAVFTRDAARGLRVARRIRSGICHVNGSTVHDEPSMPFGGVGASGHGRFGGAAGIDSFTELRWITVNGEPGRFPF